MAQTEKKTIESDLPDCAGPTPAVPAFA